jgi:hypothetical protein
LSEIHDVLHWLVQHVTRDGTVAPEVVTELLDKIDASEASAAHEPDPEPDPEPGPEPGPEPEPDPEPDPDPGQVVSDAPAQ